MSSRYVAWAGVLLVLGHLCWLQLRTGSAAHAIWDVAADRVTAGRPAKRAVRLADETQGNVLLQLVGYAKTNKAVEVSIAYCYVTTAYDLYPRRVYAAPDADHVICTGRDIMLAGFNPAPQWLDAHDVRYVLAYGNGNIHGEPQLRIRLPGNAGSTGGQNNPAGGDR